MTDFIFYDGLQFRKKVYLCINLLKHLINYNVYRTGKIDMGRIPNNTKIVLNISYGKVLVIE
ncbi:MAG: hypothetical protein LBG80_03115 [Bacteroidales bacterium]|jgi:hypothetical protein|nr:hypothetical protein [Bacteroidales bacterium]